MVEDDEDLAEVLTQYLSRFNIEVVNFYDPFIALSDIALNSYDLIILDLTLPGLDGLELCKKLIEKTKTPIIISSARSDIADKVIALELGADDYLPKPYDPRELEVRIKTILRRCSKELQMSTPLTATEIFVCDEERCHVTKNGRHLRFTQAEYEVFSILYKRKGFVVSRSKILQASEGINDDEESGSLAVIINRIRAKIEDEPKAPKYLLTIRGSGYKFVE